MRRRLRISLPHQLAILAALSISQSADAGKPVNFMLQTRVDGQALEGQPLNWTDTQMLLLGRNGQIYDFNPKKAKNSRKSGTRFFGLSINEMKEELHREFGKQLALTATTHYVVAHPHGHGDEWAERFEKLYRAFKYYFQLRGFEPTDPKYPLVGIVFRNKSEYYQYARSQGSQLQPGTLGHYEPRTNRVFLFDVTDGDGDWTKNADTIIHEVTHQSAFNTGIHTRFAGAPRWLVEGLATMFEAPGVWDAQSHQTQKDRINRGRLLEFKEFVKSRREEGFMQRLIAADNAFRSDTGGAYAEAWALSFYLSETQPRQYAKYLAMTAEREMFTEYSAAERITDFGSIFSHNLPWVEAQFLRYMEEITE